MFDTAFNKDSIIKAFVDSGIFDHRTHACPDVIRIINRFKVHWEKVPDGKAWIMKFIPLL